MKDDEATQVARVALMNIHKPSNPLPFKIYFSIVSILCLTGLADSIYLAISHYRVYTDIGYRSFCAISKAINCDTVSQSAYSIFLGVPVPIWGILGYLFVLVLLLHAWQYRDSDREAIWPTLFFISLTFSANSVFLAAISSIVIRSHCILCILSHAVNLGILFFSWRVYKRLNSQCIIWALKRDWHVYKQSWGKWIVIAGGFIAVALILIHVFPPYWRMSIVGVDSQLASGVTPEGYPWIGAENPHLVIQEFSDYQCFQCKKMHHFLRQLIARHPDKIRLIHRHFPMDHEYNPMVREAYHTGSGKMAIIALFAQSKDQFWSVNDLLFDLGAQKKDFNTRAIAEAMGVTSGEVASALDNTFFRLRLKHDIAVGIDLGVTGTPGFVIDSRVYSGTIPPPILKAVISENG